MMDKFIAYFLPIALAIVLAGCKKPVEIDPRTQFPLVRVTTAGEPDNGSQLFTGVVTARVESDLGFRVAGKVIRRLVDVGQTVRTGQTLMQIDITDYAHAITAQSENVTTQSENVAAAKARSDEASADEARYRGLVRTGAVSASLYDQFKAAADAAKAQLAGAESQLAAAQAQEKIAKNQGDYSVLVADSNGTVVETLAEPGQVVAAGQKVVTLAHAGPREAAVYLPETVRPIIGSTARAVLFGDADQSATARLRQLSDSADAGSRTFEARYVLEGKEAGAPLGATVTIHLPRSKSSGSFTVPNTAVTDRGDGPGVWVVDGKSGTVAFRPVQIIRLSDEDAYLNGGIQPGEQIVALGAHLLSQGQHVRVSDERRAESETASRRDVTISPSRRTYSARTIDFTVRPKTAVHNSSLNRIPTARSDANLF